MRRFFLALVLLLAPAIASSQAVRPLRSTVANLPSSCEPEGQIAIVTDGATPADCSTGGGSLEVPCVCGSGGTWSIAPDFVDEVCFQFTIEDITVADEWEIELPPWAGTMLSFRCEAYGGTSFTVNVCDGEDLGDDTCTTSVLGGTLACTTAGASDSTLSSAGFAADDSVSIVVTAVSGAVDWARMKMNCERD